MTFPTEAEALQERHEAIIAEGVEAIGEYERDGRIPPLLAEGLRNYLRHRIPTGGFLRAVLTNDLREAVCRAGPDVGLCELRDLVELVFNYFPGTSWGSPETRTAWLAGRE